MTPQAIPITFWVNVLNYVYIYSYCVSKLRLYL